MRDVLSSLPKIFEGYDGNEAALEATVCAAWRNAVGKGLERQTVPVRLIKRTLIVAVPSETWKRQVIDLADQMVFKINAALGSSLVSFIEFRVDARAVRLHGRKKNADRIAESEWNALVRNQLTPQLHNAAEAIADESLRDVFLVAAGSSLARRQKHDR